MSLKACVSSETEGFEKVITILTASLYLPCYGIMIYYTAKVTSSDPTDPTVGLERLARQAQSNKMAILDFNENDYQF